jgi:hypothetical protein
MCLLTFINFNTLKTGSILSHLSATPLVSFVYEHHLSLILDIPYSLIVSVKLVIAD